MVQPKPANYEREMWQELLKLMQQRRVSDFWAVYKQYLEDNNVVSRARQILHGMAGITVQEILRLNRELAKQREEIGRLKAAGAAGDRCCAQQETTNEG